MARLDTVTVWRDDAGRWRIHTTHRWSHGQRYGYDTLPPDIANRDDALAVATIRHNLDPDAWRPHTTTSDTTVWTARPAGATP